MKLAIYISKLFLPVFAVSVLVFSFVLEIVDLMMNIWKYIYNAVPVQTILLILLNNLPRTISWAVPLSVLFASCFMLSNLYSKNELTAIFASGVSLIRFTLPLIVFSAFLSCVHFVFMDKVVVPSSVRYEELKKKALRQRESLNNDHIVILSDGGKVIYKADYYDDDLQRLHQLYVIVRNENKELEYILKAEFATWNKNDCYWMLSNGVQYTYDAEQKNLTVKNVLRDKEKLLTEVPETFQNNTLSVEAATVREARTYIKYLQRTGLPFNEALSQYYNKFSFPFIIVIVAFLSIGISGKSERNVFVISLTLSVSAAVLFYITQMITMLMAKFGTISPFAGAWFPVLLFVALSGILLKYTRT